MRGNTMPTALRSDGARLAGSARQHFLDDQGLYPDLHFAKRDVIEALDEAKRQGAGAPAALQVLCRGRPPRAAQIDEKLRRRGGAVSSTVIRRGNSSQSGWSWLVSPKKSLHQPRARPDSRARRRTPRYPA